MAALQANKDDTQYQEVLSKLGELFVFVKSAKRGTDPLDPAKLGVEPIAISTVAPLVSAAVGLDNAPRTRTGNTDRLPPPPPSIIPTGTFATPTTTGHADTQPLPVTKPESTPDAK